MVGVVERCEGYVDDLQAICRSFENISNIYFLISRFKPLSGAILNRSTKSKIMGLGEWRGRTQWPLALVKSVESLRVFVIFLTSDWAEIPDMNLGSQLSIDKKTLRGWTHQVHAGHGQLPGHARPTMAPLLFKGWTP